MQPLEPMLRGRAAHAAVDDIARGVRVEGVQDRFQLVDVGALAVRDGPEGGFGFAQFKAALGNAVAQEGDRHGRLAGDVAVFFGEPSQDIQLSVHTRIPFTAATAVLLPSARHTLA